MTTWPALTVEHFGDRIVGTSDQGSVSVRCSWFATGNNPLLTPELLSRAIRSRLDAKTERPDLRRFKNPDLQAWIAENRKTLVWACLTLIQSWVDAGQPQGERIHGRYPAWSRVLGGICKHGQIEGFLENLDEHRNSSDAHEPFRDFVEQ